MIVQWLSTVKLTFPLSPAQCRMIAAFDLEARTSQLPVTVTCGEEDHKPTDPHTLKKAFDVRTKDRQPTEVREMYWGLKHSLGPKFTVIFEVQQKPSDLLLAEIATVNPKATAPHIHVQVKIGYEYP